MDDLSRRFRRSWRLGGHLSGYAIIRRHDLRQDDHALPRLDASKYVHDVRTCLSSLPGAWEPRDYLSGHQPPPGHPSSPRHASRQSAIRLQEFLRRGELLIVREPGTDLHQSGVEEAAEQPLGAQSTPPAASSKGWVEFKVVNDKTNAPIAGVQLTVKLPDGGVVQKTTDSGGFIYIYEILDGDCEISCDLAGAQLPSAYDFVRNEVGVAHQ